MNSTVFLFLQKPVYQALIFLILTPIVILIFRPKSSERVWLIALYTFILFLIANAGLSWFADRPWLYFFYSIASSIGYLLIIGMLVPLFINVLRLEKSGESAMAFIILIYQPFVLLLVMILKWIIQ